MRCDQGLARDRGLVCWVSRAARERSFAHGHRLGAPPPASAATVDLRHRGRHGARVVHQADAAAVAARSARRAKGSPWSTTEPDHERWSAATPPSPGRDPVFRRASHELRVGGGDAEVGLERGEHTRPVGSGPRILAITGSSAVRCFEHASRTTVVGGRLGPAARRTGRARDDQARSRSRARHGTDGRPRPCDTTTGCRRLPVRCRARAGRGRWPRPR